MIKSKRMIWTEHAARIRNAINVKKWMESLKGRELSEDRRKWEDNIKKDL
jgi:hypothetical protein